MQQPAGVDAHHRQQDRQSGLGRDHHQQRPVPGQPERQQAAAAETDGFRGCPFQMALAEFPDPAHPAHATAVRTKAEVRDRLRAVAGELGGPDPDALTDQLLLVMEGVYATIPAFGTAGPAARARTVAELILSAVPRRKGRRPAC